MMPRFIRPTLRAPRTNLVAGDTPFLAFDFTQSFFPIVGSATPTFTRATTAWRFNASGLLEAVLSGFPRFDYDPTTHAPLGLLCEETRTNLAKWNRDLTNAVWTKSNTTAALDQVGLDGVSNSASSVTATADAGTALQAITSASAARITTAYVKRITGSGTIEMTQDGGTGCARRSMISLVMCLVLGAGAIETVVAVCRFGYAGGWSVKSRCRGRPTGGLRSGRHRRRIADGRGRCPPGPLRR